ncbi:MAG: PrsW family glutamic-type intramembrane protease [candidate division WOR-3 bacterium]|nr:PrsW family glutamic-type intramembrane protease [candidate division WOR-3 bacterium]
MSFWLLLLAIVPGIALLLFFYFRDRYKKEPLWPIFLAFVLGAFVTLPASASSSFLQRLSGWLSPGAGIMQIFLGTFLIIGLVEEGWKFFVVRFYCYHRPEFDEPYDGIMYSTAVALGFATLENILYVFSPGMLGGLRIGIMRAFMAVPSHAFYGVLMGFFLGEAKFARSAGDANRLGLVGFLLAVAAHGLYDFIVIVLPRRPLLTGSLIVFSVLAWVVFFEATRRQAEKSAHRAPELVQLARQERVSEEDRTGSTKAQP